MAKKRKKRKLKLKNIFLFLVLLFLILYLIYYFLMLPINNIYIIGNDIVSETEIIDLAKLEDYPSFILSYSWSLEKKIKKNDYISDVTIKKKFGNKLYVIVEEYTPLCIINNDRVLLSNNSIVDNKYSLIDIPYLISDLDGDVLQEFSHDFVKVDSDILRQISEIEYDPLNVDKERFLLHMNDGNEVYITLRKISKLNKYDEILQKMNSSKGVIYLDSGDYIEVKNN